MTAAETQSEGWWASPGPSGDSLSLAAQVSGVVGPELQGLRGPGCGEWAGVLGRGLGTAPGRHVFLTWASGSVSMWKHVTVPHRPPPSHSPHCPPHAQGHFGLAWIYAFRVSPGETWGPGEPL